MENFLVGANATCRLQLSLRMANRHGLITGATGTGKTITLHVEGSSAADLARGVAAAEAVFNAANVAPWDAARAHFEREGWELGQFAHDISDATLDAAAVLDVAEHAALEACCGGDVPGGAHMQFHPPA